MGFLTPKRPMLPVDPNEERRPSHWNEEVNEREIDPMRDYPTELDHGTLSELGFAPAPNPQPVYLTEAPPADRKIVRWSAGNFTVDTDTYQLAGADRRRVRMQVSNEGDTNAVYLLTEREAQSFVGRYLAPGSSIVFYHDSDVWVRAAASTTLVTWHVEYELDD